MEFFNRTLPWFLVSIAILAIATGMNASPGRMIVSGQLDIVIDGATEKCYGPRQSVDCPGDSERDGVYRLIGRTNNNKDPYIRFRDSVRFAQADIDHTIRTLLQ